MDDRALIRKAKMGDGDAVRSLYERHSRHVWAVVRRIADDDATAEDWAQEAWVRAIRALPEFREESRFSTWLHRIAVNAALQGRRSGGRRSGREVPLDATGVLADPAPADQPLLRKRLQAAIERLPERMRRVLVLHDVEGYTHEEIGEILGVTAGTCKSQLFKARAKMREMLSPAPDPVKEWETQTCST